jgi:hypothetical protein
MTYDTAAYAAETPISHKQIIAGGTYTTRKATVLSGQVQPAGAVMGKITSGGKYILSLSAASDGSQTPDMILAHDVDASGGDVEALFYETCTGGVVGSALTIGASHTLASIREGLRAKGLPIDD